MTVLMIGLTAKSESKLSTFAFNQTITPSGLHLYKSKIVSQKNLKIFCDTNITLDEY